MEQINWRYQHTDLSPPTLADKQHSANSPMGTRLMIPLIEKPPMPVILAGTGDGASEMSIWS